MRLNQSDDQSSRWWHQFRNLLIACWQSVKLKYKWVEVLSGFGEGVFGTAPFPYFFHRVLCRFWQTTQPEYNMKRHTCNALFVHIYVSKLGKTTTFDLNSSSTATQKNKIIIKKNLVLTKKTKDATQELWVNKNSLWQRGSWAHFHWPGPWLSWS